MPPRFNSVLRTVLRTSAWVMAPFCLGLVAALLLVLAQFVRELVHAVTDFNGMTGPDIILIVLKLVDLMLLGNLVIMIVVAGIEIFAPASADAGNARSEWDGIMEFAGLKPKLFASISAIAAIDLLESYINIEATDKAAVGWEILILVTFVLAGAVLAWTDKIMHEKH
ncbi:MAG: YqhA family protein [Alphaproteobacteria bacterium]|nr:YqhA family protein [Alphaproteobacteria bacterium]